MRRMAVVGVVLLLAHTTPAFADAKRGAEAFSRGDYFLAEREWREAAQTGDVSAMMGLGTLYDTGHGVPQDFAQALSWYRRAANAGDAHAMFNVGAMYDNGRGTDVNRREAISWYVRSATRGNGRAAYVAATIYRDGDGVPRNTTVAIRLFKLAAAAGVSAARISLTNLGQGASPAAPTNAVLLPRTASKSTAAAVKHPPAVRSTSADAPTVVAEPAGPPAMSPAVPPDGAAMAEPLPPPVADHETPAAPAETANNDFAVAAINIPVNPVQPADPPRVEILAPEATAAGIEHFHTVALQQADVSAFLSKQYESIVREIARRAMEGNEVAQYDTGFAYERGVGLPPDLVRAYVYYIRATSSPDPELKTAALKEASKVADQLTDTQFMSAVDMVTDDLR